MSIESEPGLALRPLLLKFARRQQAEIRDCRYDPAQSLNVSLGDGLPLIASPEGRARLKTVKIFRSFED